jgi:hypothetical protein
MNSWPPFFFLLMGTGVSLVVKHDLVAVFIKVIHN